MNSINHFPTPAHPIPPPRECITYPIRAPPGRQDGLLPHPALCSVSSVQNVQVPSVLQVRRARLGNRQPSGLNIHGKVREAASCRGKPTRESGRERVRGLLCPGRKKVKCNLESVGFYFRGTNLFEADIKTYCTSI